MESIGASLPPPCIEVKYVHAVGPSARPRAELIPDFRNREVQVPAVPPKTTEARFDCPVHHAIQIDPPQPC